MWIAVLIGGAWIEVLPLNQLDAVSILSDDVLDEVFDQEDEIYKARLILSLQDRAIQLGVKTKFDNLVKAYKKVEREIQRAERMKNQKIDNAILENWTNFSDCPYDRMKCGNWIATDRGIYISNPNPMMSDIQACPHPIIPIGRYKNIITQKEQIKIAYKRNHTWRELTLPKELTASASKIVSLASMGVLVTSESAKFLVKYLANVESENDDYLEPQLSSSKLGWVNSGNGSDDVFIPYDEDVDFDGDIQFHDLFESVKPFGSYDVWKEHVIKIRKRGRKETKFLLAASFASILVKRVGALPFFVDLAGNTEGGKTVALMVAASVWANPAESKYIGDFKTTDNALELKQNVLNNLPLFLDDSSKVSKKVSDNFEGFVYDLCSGKGKSRSNKELGIRSESYWSNIIVCNGEHPLSGYVSQGGAINRILEVKAMQDIFENPQETCEVIKSNYGHAGKEFVDIVKGISIPDLRHMVNSYQDKLLDDDNMQKQVLAMSILLVADELVEKYIFQDGNRISLEEAREILTSRLDLDENIRAYETVIGTVEMNPDRFQNFLRENTFGEVWGQIKGDEVQFIPAALNKLCEREGVNKKSFLGWCLYNNLLVGNGDKDCMKVVKYRKNEFGETSTRKVISILIVEDIKKYIYERNTEPKFD